MEYQTILTLKESGKATVELAAADVFDGPVVIKRLRGGKAEIYQKIAGQENPHIPKIYAVEEAEEELLVAEEYIEGESLREYLQQNLLSDEEKICLALQLCDAVEFLHAMKPMVIHRDIKPSNILVNSKGQLKLIDFDVTALQGESCLQFSRRSVKIHTRCPPCNVLLQPPPAGGIPVRPCWPLRTESGMTQAHTPEKERKERKREKARSPLPMIPRYHCSTFRTIMAIIFEHNHNIGLYQSTSLPRQGTPLLCR